MRSNSELYFNARMWTAIRNHLAAVEAAALAANAGEDDTLRIPGLADVTPLDLEPQEERHGKEIIPAPEDVDDADVLPFDATAPEDKR